jgi:tetratricopeptide (TPR) repeat protein
MAIGTTGQPNPSFANEASALAEVDRLRRAGRMLEAENLCRSLVAKYPKSPNSLNVLSLLLRARGDFAESGALMRRAIDLAPREPALHNNLGNVLIAAGDRAGAESAYRKAVGLKPDYPEAWYNLGLVLKDLGQPDAAIAAQRRAVALRQRYTQALVQLGALLIENNSAEDALEPLRAAVAASADSYDARYYLGVALNHLERFDEAIPILQQAVDLAPKRHEARFAVSNAFSRVGREEDALRGYQTAFEAKPDFLPALYEFTALAWSLGNDVRSLESYAYARKRVGDTPDLLLAEAGLRMRFFDLTGAEMLLRNAHNQVPQRADVSAALGNCFAQQSRYDQSFPLFQEAVAAEPAVVAHRRDFGEALLRAGEDAEARRVLEEALALDRHDQITLAYLTLAYRQLGDSRYDALVDHARFVREYDIEPPPGFASVDAFNRALAEELEELHRSYAPPIDQTLRNGTQTVGTLFNRRSHAIEALRERIRDVVADYVRNMPQDSEHPLLGRKQDEFSFSGSWSCRLRSTGYHTNHVHDQGWISSAYYVSLPDPVAAGEGGQGALKFAESRLGLGERDRPARIVQPMVGKLVLFPSYFWHGTVPFQSDAMRLTVAFDAIPGKPDRRTPFRSGY